MKGVPSGALRVYRRAVKETLTTGQATEHSYRPALQALVEGTGGDGVIAVNEPSHIICGAPDFVVVRDGVPLGHIECKDVRASLDQVEVGEQLTRYRAGLPNLILTDYLEFRRYADGELRETARLGRIDPERGIISDRDGTKAIGALFEAFLAADPPAIADPRELARRMASKARLLRDCVERILREEDGSGPLSNMLVAYRKILIADLAESAFADLQAQTAAYGLFAARCLHGSDGSPFTRQSAVFVDTTPFLRDVFGRIAGPGIDPRIAWIVDDLALLLDRADMASVLADFGRRTLRGDPVVHFYEDFLAAYDPQLREMRGVYYTPEPVVSWIVRSVDRLLRESFGLADGLAETLATGNEEPPVLILDPAAGTGTFLREAIAHIRTVIEDKGLGGAWPDYVRNHLLTRLFGFELLMAPYAICHLKLALEIGGTDADFRMPDGQRLGVFLTNTLQEPHEQSSAPLFAHELALEAASADSVKRDRPVMVVIGNPPYSGHSANNGAWIRGLLRGQEGEEVTGTGSYFHVNGRHLGERNPKWLNDDYVKFIRFAQWRIERTGEGILGFVTNHAYLDNPTFRAMRRCLMEAFDEIRLLDLHGNAKKSERAPDGGKDENVFDIQQGVAIGLFIKHRESGHDPARVFHSDLWGERESGAGGGKYGWLVANDVSSTEWTELSPRPPLYLFVPRDEELSEEYETNAKLTDVFPVHSVGIVTARDRLTIQWTEGDMRRVAKDFVSCGEEEARSIFNLGPDSGDWSVADAQDDIRKHSEANRHVCSIHYRPFDMRFTYYTGRASGFICRPRPKVMRHMQAGPNLALISCRQQSQANAEWGNCNATRSIIESCVISNKTKEINYLFPLYTYPEEGRKGFGANRKPNLDFGFQKAVSTAVGLDFVPDGPGNLSTTFGPEDVFHYVYAVLHSPEYRRRYAEFLKTDFPRIPLTVDRPLFAVLADLGHRLVALHLMEAEGPELPAFQRAGSNRVDRVRYSSGSPGVEVGRVWINPQQCFEGVSSETWEFAVGGYRPAEKWLKDRKNRRLSFDDIAHYSRICAALAETRRIMAYIDEAIEARGGWPLNQD